MLWYKSWLETRWRFVIGLVLLLLSACGTVVAYPEVMRLLPTVTEVEVGGEIGRRLKESIDLSRTYRGFVWSYAFQENLPQMLGLFAVLLGAGGLLAQAGGGGALFTLSLPVTRDRMVGIRAATGLAELLVLALVPPLLLPLLSPAIGESYAVGDALAHGLCMFVACSALFSLSFLLSTVFSDVWRPALITIGVAVTLLLAEQLLFGRPAFGLHSVMIGESYFRRGALPWAGFVLGGAASAAMIYAATRNIARQDF